MTLAGRRPRDRRAERRDWVEIAATVLLACAAVATAWSSYQATRWNGEQAKTAGRVTKVRLDASRAADLANAQQQVDVATFMQWVDSYARSRRPARELLPRALPHRVQARVRTRGSPRSRSRRKGAPPTPFVMPQYRLAAKAEADRLDQDGRGARGASPPGHPAVVQLCPRRRPLRGCALLRGDEHEAHRARIRKTMLAVGWILFLGTAVWIATSPVSVAV